MSILLIAGSIALSLVAALTGAVWEGWALIAAFLIAVAAAGLGARGALVLFALLLAVSMYFLAPQGATAAIEGFGLNPRAVFRDWAAAMEIVAAAVIAAVFFWGLSRRGPSLWHAAVEASDDIAAVVNRIGEVAALLFIPLMVIIFYDITQRTILGWRGDFIESVFYLSSTKMQEMQWHLHAVLFLLCLGYAYQKDAHVRIELVRDKLAPRTRVWLELIGAALFLFAYCAVIVKFGFTFTERAFATGEVSAAQTGLTHRWIIKAFLPVGFIVLGATGVSAVLKCLVYLYGPAELRPRVNEYAGTHHADLPDDVRTRGPVAD
jgi:TRAP-type mannitol/chloroaromatic compound transport system permease small subunit